MPSFNWNGDYSFKNLNLNTANRKKKVNKVSGKQDQSPDLRCAKPQPYCYSRLAADG